MIKTILFDWNGTLLDDVCVNMEATNFMLKKRGMKTMGSLEEYRNLFEFPVINYYRKLNFNFEKESFEELSVEFMDEYNRRFKECTLMHGAEEFLQMLHDKNISCNILSASKQENLLSQIKVLNCGQLFDEVIGILDIYAASKIETAKNWIKNSQKEPNEILMIGDSVHDYEVATAIGIKAVLVACGHQSKEKLKKTGAPVFNDLKEIKTWSDLLK